MKRSSAMIFLLCCLACLRAGAQRFERYDAARLNRRIAGSDTLFILNFWATWCGPCVKELPQFDQLQKLYAGKPVKVLLVSFDFPKEYEEKLARFVAAKKPLPEIVWFSETDANAFIPKLDSNWSGALPATILRKGAAHWFWEGTITKQQVAAVANSWLPQHP